jgi:protein-S-isoprenylcysteine O-methyltransferase Ste14
MNAPLPSDLEIDSDIRAHDPRPKSAVSAMTGVVGLAGLFAWTAVARVYGMAGPLAALCGLVACGLPMVLWAIFVDKVHRNPSTGIDWDSPPRRLKDIADISIAKLAGLWGIWAIIGGLYCIGRWYWDGQYLFAMYVLGYSIVPVLLLSVPYVFWLDRRLKEPKDGAWHFGQLLIGRSERTDEKQLADFYRAWAVKGFFLAFMISIVPGNWWESIAATPEQITRSPVAMAQWLIAIMFMIDVTFATVGYVLTLKPLDAHIRRANPFAAGWVAALICYPPFILMNDGGPLDYSPGAADWSFWLQNYPLLTAVWGAVLVILTGIYAWATVAFGIRFSNLTHRGVLTNGPYALTRHPAYVSKNLFWWLAGLPFLATTGSYVDMIRNTAILAMVSGVYYWRAKTEEKHLSEDPAYVEYSRWIDRNGPVTRFLHALKPGGERRDRPEADPVAAE